MDKESCRNDEQEDRVLLGSSSEHERLLVCDSWSKTFKYKSSLSRHKKTKCGTAKLYQCPTCSKEFDRKDSLKRHASDGCKGSKPKQTAYHRCGKEFQTNWHLERHSKTYSEKCPRCKEKIERNLAATWFTSEFQLEDTDKEHLMLKKIESWILNTHKTFKHW